MSMAERQKKIQLISKLNEEDIDYLNESISTLEKAGQGFYIENTIGVQQVPLGIATNFKINGEDVLIPMAVEEAYASGKSSASRPAACNNSSDQHLFTTSKAMVLAASDQSVAYCPVSLKFIKSSTQRNFTAFA